ncbi:MAG: IclR family transcriptional regulator [Albidovulum sp.]|nr:IclR family transcriptional regulator [Albidovulum sp.]
MRQVSSGGRQVKNADGRAINIEDHETWTSRTIQSVERAFDILEFLAEAESGVQLREIALETGLNVSTCHHLVSTLLKRGYARKGLRDRQYRLGGKIHDLSNKRLQHFNILDLAMPELRSLSDSTGETVQLSVMQSHELTTLAKVSSKKSLATNAQSYNGKNAAHATAAGKAILAWLPETEIARVIAGQGIARFTDRTILKLADLLEELRLVRRNGFAVDNEEFQAGIASIAAAIRNQKGAVIGSISCSMPESRANGEEFEAACNAVRQTASILSRMLGNHDENAVKMSDAA